MKNLLEGSWQHAFGQQNLILESKVYKKFRCDQRSKREGLSFGSSIKYVFKPDILNGADFKYIVHIDPIVLARCGLICSIYQELQYMPSEGSAVFEKQIDGRYALNKNMQLVFCANFSPACLL
ncbi:Protein CBG04340 [Caenorhabditis briggsae]|uniref:Protein CBG04340 n=1 Tax=Caenorhabditis briggsae TaxID=6238 RepID=A8WXB2_CAEBR|nr:Protein CBG04340 [Caenorhabditis briggsae]CAP25072.1 Protein CBG04340 [Caenorhabditis briggsae]